jgi:integrase
MQRLYRKRDPRDPSKLLPNWYVRIGDVCRSTGCRDKRAAEARARQLERAQHAPPDAGPPTTLAEALERAMSDRRQRGRAEGTLEMWMIKAGQLLRVLGGDTPLSEVDAKAVDAYVTRRLEGTENEEPVKRGTVAKELGVLAVTLKLARRRGEYALDPAAVLPQGLGSDYQPRTRALSPTEAQRLLADLLDDDLPMVRDRAGPERVEGSRRSLEGLAPETSTYERTRQRSMRDRAARVAFIIATSARWSESERARVEDIDWSSGLVLVRGSKTATARRYVPILPSTAPLLRLALEHGNDEGLLFTPWLNVRRDLHSACRRVGIPPVSPNDLRRTTSQWLRSAGVEPHLIAAVLGHADARMVERVYGKITPEALRAALLERTGKVAALLPARTRGTRRRKRRTG